MSDDTETCAHQWGEAELCETPHGNIHSPTCGRCGAVKLVAERRRPAPRAVATNQPPAGAPAVHPFQAEIFTDL